MSHSLSRRKELVCKKRGRQCRPGCEASLCFAVVPESRELLDFAAVRCLLLLGSEQSAARWRFDVFFFSKRSSQAPVETAARQSLPAPVGQLSRLSASIFQPFCFHGRLFSFYLCRLLPQEDSAEVGRSMQAVQRAQRWAAEALEANSSGRLCAVQRGG